MTTTTTTNTTTTNTTTSMVDVQVIKVESCPQYISNIIKMFPSMTIDQLSVITDYNQYFKNYKLPQKKSDLFIRVGWESVDHESTYPIKELINDVCFSKFSVPDNDMETICDVYKAILKFIVDKKLDITKDTIKCHFIKGVNHKLCSYEGLFPDELFNSWEDA